MRVQDTPALTHRRNTHIARPQVSRALGLTDKPPVGVIDLHGALKGHHVGGGLVSNAAVARWPVRDVRCGPVGHAQTLHVVIVPILLVLGAVSSVLVKDHMVLGVGWRGTLFRVWIGVARVLGLEHDGVWPGLPGHLRVVRERHDQHTGTMVRLAAVEGVLHKRSGGGGVTPVDRGLVHAAVVAVEGNVEDTDHVAFVGDDGSLCLM